LPDQLQFFRWLAAGFGSGWLPKAPGTWGSLISLLPAWLLLELSGVSGLFLASSLILIIGCLVCFLVLPSMAEKDPGWIVIDEWAGQWLCLAMVAGALGTGWLAFVVSFAAFRLLDIFKPCPISYFEHWGPPWWSIMADDVAAAVLGGGVVIVTASFI
jgi:phosphatidylglycerophosphatase A